jgi:NAD(P)-dependent dehydrogenase (short-subunit alcohol dehydrogenase family)
MQMKILLTGSSKGIGKKILIHLKKKHKIFTIERSDINSENHFKCDLRDVDKLREISKRIPKLDVIINNAGISVSSKDKIENFVDIVNTNLNSAFYVSTLFLKHLKKSKNASIINISSINAYQGFPNNPGYVASKSGLIGLTRSLALDYGKYNIRVNAISPGYLSDGMTLRSFKNKKTRSERSKRTILNRWGKASDVFGMIDYLISDKSSYTTGQDFIIDGGWLAKGL